MKLNEKRQRALGNDDAEQLPTFRKQTVHTDEENSQIIASLAGEATAHKMTPQESEQPTKEEETPQHLSSTDCANNTQPAETVFESGMCKEHNRKLELVCLDHRCRICANCALFGTHKNHDFRTEEEVLKEITCRAECLIDLFQIIDTNQHKMLNQDFMGKLNVKLRNKYEDLSKQIHDKFNVISFF